MAIKMMEGYYKGVQYRYTPHTSADEGNGILIITLTNGVESTHIIKNWGAVRIFQYVASFENVV